MAIVMCDPLFALPEIPRDSLKKEIGVYSKETVEEYLNNKNSFKKYPVWHYSQLEVDFNPKIVENLLQKLSIPTKNIAVTVFGGFTGQFALSLRNVGLSVIFTDPLIDWVENASCLNFESYRYTMQKIPKNIVKRTDLFATFECYPAMGMDCSRTYDLLRLLTVKQGFLFAESKRTRYALDGDVGRRLGRYKGGFLPYAKIYGIKRAFRENKNAGLRFYHFCANEDAREDIKRDCKTMKGLYDSFTKLKIDDEMFIDKQKAKSFASAQGIHYAGWLSSLARILDLYQIHMAEWYKQCYNIDPLSFRIYNKGFKVDRELIENIEK